MTVTFDASPVSDVGPASWLVDADLADRVSTVGSCVPGGFEAYARILHPARAAGTAATWAQIAAWSGRQLTSDSDSADLMVRPDGARWEDIAGNQRPGEGTGGLDSDRFNRLTTRLAEATTTDDQLWGLFDVIEYPVPTEAPGYRADSRTDRGPIFDRRDERPQPERMDELEARSGVDLAGGRYILHRGRFGPDDGALASEPSYWWPDDHAWLVHTNVDCPTTYVAGTAELVERLIADDVLEVVTARLDDPFDGHQR